MVEHFIHIALPPCVFGHVRSSGGSFCLRRSPQLSGVFLRHGRIIRTIGVASMMPLHVVRRRTIKIARPAVLYSICNVWYLLVHHVYSILSFSRRRQVFPHLRSWVDMPLSFECGRVQPSNTSDIVANQEYHCLPTGDHATEL